MVTDMKLNEGSNRWLVVTKDRFEVEYDTLKYIISID